MFVKIVWLLAHDPAKTFPPPGSGIISVPQPFVKRVVQRRVVAVAGGCVKDRLDTLGLPQSLLMSVSVSLRWRERVYRMQVRITLAVRRQRLKQVTHWWVISLIPDNHHCADADYIVYVTTGPPGP